ncbi:DUF305 domain-containing protein [Pseudonocardia alaniniphila]|uniref:DUF305 domain-containing protein n=1 Tax=Pseudonocardia alaniniphila TaxID=75291 RepID=A0ABS9TG63_9PSEU|nr:DUF305 domain-containing protein [Pseudonocardia alaniniphila]
MAAVAIAGIAIAGTTGATAATAADPPTTAAAVAAEIAADPAATVAAQQIPGGSTPILNTAQQYANNLRGLSRAQAEQAFLAGMIRHHAAAISMAQLELARGANPEVKALAQQIISGQSQEITEMTNWLRDWYGLTPAQAKAREPADMQKLATRMAAGMTNMTTQLAAVPAGPASDKAFLSEMIPHHEMAIVIPPPMTTQAEHPALRALAGQIITAQLAQVRQMSTWLRDSYGVTTAVRT